MQPPNCPYNACYQSDVPADAQSLIPGRSSERQKMHSLGRFFLNISLYHSCLMGWVSQSVWDPHRKLQSSLHAGGSYASFSSRLLVIVGDPHTFGANFLRCVQPPCRAISANTWESSALPKFGFSPGMTASDHGACLLGHGWNVNVLEKEWERIPY